MDPPRLDHVRVNVGDFAPPEAPAYAHFDTGGAQFAISELGPAPGGARVVDPDGNELGLVREA